jgi:3-oxoacyl-[acyl-carrier-protein] synthase III
MQFTASWEIPLVETTDAWIRARTGIRTRRAAVPGESAADLAVRSAVPEWLEIAS